MDSFNLANQMIKLSATNILLKMPNFLKKHISLSNVINTHILVIEGKAKSDEIKSFLEREGFDNIDTKIENNCYTLVLQASGFKIGANLNDLVNKTEENMGMNTLEMSIEIQRLKSELEHERREIQLLKDKCANNSMTSDEIKIKYVDRSMLSDNIREYVLQDSRLLMVLSMLGIKTNVLQGDIIGNVLNI